MTNKLAEGKGRRMEDGEGPSLLQLRGDLEWREPTNELATYSVE